MFITYGDSRTGLVRKINEDSISDCAGPFFILADGMGGYAGGQIASSLAIENASDFLKNIQPDDFSEDILKESILRANRKILEIKHENEGLSGMGTTMISSVIHESSLSWAHVGDSRLYVFREGNLIQLTTDHSFVMELLAEGKITEEEMCDHPRKNEITRAVGIKESLDVDTGTVHLESGTLILLCSDGLTGMVSEAVISQILAGYRTPTRKELVNCGERLFEAVYAAGAHDNVSLILIDYWNKENGDRT